MEEKLSRKLKEIKLGDVFGVYKVVGGGGHTNRGTPRYKCECLKCGHKRIFSASYLINSTSIRECICNKERGIREIHRDYVMIQKKYGTLNLCGSCVHLFNCVVNRYNAIDPNFIKKYKVEKIADRVKNKTRNLILVYECDKFEFDWGENKQ